MKIKGIRTDCITKEEKEVELEYEIQVRSNQYGINRRIFRLLNGVTGYEGFYIDNENGKPESVLLKMLKRNGWKACMGTPRFYDELVISAEEMRKALEGIT